MTLTMATTVDLLARDLPPEFVTKMDAEYDDEEPLGPDDEIPDIEVEIEFEPGYHQDGIRSGHPDNWTPDEGEDPQVTKVTIIDGDHDVTDVLSKQQFAALTHAAWEDQQHQGADADCDPPDAHDYYNDR
jgi:hypothetical protein